MHSLPDDVIASSLSTAAFRPHESTSAWRELFGRTLLGVDMTPLTDRFEAEATALKWPGFGLMSAKTSPVHQANSAAMVSNDDLTFGWVSFPDTSGGRWTTSQSRRESAIAPGEGVLLSNGDPGTVTIPTACRLTVFALPADVLKPLVPDLDVWRARPVPAATPALRLLSGYLHLAWDPKLPRNAQLRGRFATHVADLLALTLGAGRDAAEVARLRGARAARLHAVRRDVERRLGEADLSVVGTAARHRVSTRYLQLLFEESGSTFTEFVTERRLWQAYRHLADPTRRGTLVSTIAYDCGFSDISHFNRLFRRRFGCTPSDIRAAARAASDGTRPPGRRPRS